MTSKSYSKEQLKIVYFADGIEKSVEVEMDSLFTDGMLDRKKVLWSALRNENDGVAVMDPKVINKNGDVIAP